MSIVIRPQININAAGVTMKINKAARDAVPGIADDIRKDCNKYAPQRYGNLISHSNTVAYSGEPKADIKWGVIYANYVYKGISRSGRPLKYSTYPNINARAKWAAYAKRMHLVQWRDMLEARMKAKYHEQ